MKKLIRINGKPYKTDEDRISYEQILAVTKLPLGSSVFWMNTKRCREEEFASGILDTGEMVDIINGLHISAMAVDAEPMVS